MAHQFEFWEECLSSLHLAWIAAQLCLFRCHKKSHCCEMHGSKYPTWWCQFYRKLIGGLHFLFSFLFNYLGDGGHGEERVDKLSSILVALIDVSIIVSKLRLDLSSLKFWDGFIFLFMAVDHVRRWPLTQVKCLLLSQVSELWICGYIFIANAKPPLANYYLVIRSPHSRGFVCIS